VDEQFANRFAAISLKHDHPFPKDEAADVLAQLRLLIAQATAKPDVPLPTERELALRFGVSRRSLRRALSVLETEGRIWRRQGKGTFVGPAASTPSSGLSRISSRTNYFEVMEVRLQIEPPLAQLAALRASGEQIAMLRRLAASTRIAADADELELWDSAFHRCIAEAGGNRLFIDLFEVVDAVRRDRAWRCYRDRARTPERLRLYLDQHHDIAEAIAVRDAAGAARIMRQHIAAVQQAFIAATAGELEDAI
jgi:GntR family transcriptional regulator, transcriptional repressor for pyruvate dehydrogenase complex